MRILLALFVLVSVAYANLFPERILNKLGPVTAKIGPVQHRNHEKFDLQKLAHIMKHLKQAKASQANMNAYIDHLFADLDQWILENGWEPFPVPDMDLEISTGDIIPIHGDLFLRNGELYGMSTMHRKGDCILYYGNKLMSVHLPLSFYDLSFFFDFEVDLLINPSGQITGEILDLLIMVDITVDLQNYEIFLNSFEFTDAGTIDIVFHGEPLVDWLLNILADLLTWLLHDTVLGLVHDMMVPQLETMIADLNTLIKDLLDGNFQPNPETFIKYLH